MSKTLKQILMSKADYNAIKHTLGTDTEVILTDTNLASGESKIRRKDDAGNEVQIATSATVQTAISSVVINDWQPNIAVALNEMRRVTVAVSGYRVGDLIRSTSARTTGAVFNATEAANWIDSDINLVTSVAGRTGDVILAQGDVGLGNVNNTADTAKPVSTAQQTALDLKVDKVTGKGLSTNDYTTAEQTKLAGIATGATAVTVENVLTSTNTATALSAAQGKMLQDGKQATLVSGTNIKTVNNQSLVGSGDLPVAAGSLQIATISATGGVKTTSGIYTVHTFTGSGTFIPNGSISVDYLVVAGGGGGGSGIGGGGGAGGLLTGTITVNGTTAITVGAGGAGGSGGSVNGVAGSNSVFGTITAIGGGYGGVLTTAGGNGGSGGGTRGTVGGTGTVGQGNNGGNIGTGNNGTAGGGGGAGAVGTNAAGNSSGAGGAGTSSSITGTATVYAGGGGGGGYVQGGTLAGAGGNGGGGAGGVGAAGTAGTANTGGGGGGGGYDNAAPTNYAGGAGGSGVIIIRYLTATTVITTPIYSSNAAALAAGLTIGNLYRSGADPDVINVVH